MYDLNIYLKILVLLTILLLITNIILIILGYNVCKWFCKELYNEYFQINSYTNSQKIILKKYGNYNVNKIYLTKNTIKYWYNNKKESNNYAIICELNINKEQKLLLIEKNTNLRIKPNFNIKESDRLKTIKLEKKWKFKDILNNTKKRIGKKKFFNWNIYKNNCKYLMKEILITLGKFNKENEEFLSQDINIVDLFTISNIFTNLLY